MEIRKATPDDLDMVSEIAGQFRDELGFVMKVALERSMHRGEFAGCRIGWGGGE